MQASNKADIWDITITQPKVVLRPGTASLVIGEQVTFEVTVPEQSQSGVNLVYKWKNTATRGHLKDGLAGHKDDFDSSKNKATYIVESEGEGIDTVTVEAYALTGPNQKTREYIGKANAEIKTPSGQGTINVNLGERSSSMWYFNYNLMKKGGSVFLDSHWTNVVDDPGYWHSSFGPTQYPFGEYKIVVYTYDMQCKLVDQAACTFTLKSGQKDVYLTCEFDYFVGGDDPMSNNTVEDYGTGGGVGWAGLSRLNVKGPNYFAYFDDNPGDEFETEEAWYNNPYSDLAGDATLIVGPIYLHSFRDGERYKIFEGGDFSGSFPIGETVIATQKHSIPALKSLLPGPSCVLKTKTTTLATSPTTSKPTTTSTTNTPTTTKTTTTSTTTTPTTNTTPTPSTTTQTTTATSTSTVPGKLPLTQMNVWFSIVNDPNAAHVENIIAGTVNTVYLWAQAPVNQEGDFTIWVTIQDGSRTQIQRHASNGDIVSCGSLTGDFLKTVGTIGMHAGTGNSTLGDARLNITKATTTPTTTTTTPGALSPIQTVVTNLTKNSGAMPPGATVNNDWWYWELTLKNPNNIGVTILSGQKYISTPYEEGTSDLGKSIVDVFGTNYLPAGGEITWHNAYMYFSKRSTPFPATRTVTFYGKDDLGRDVTIQYTLNVTVD